MYSNKDRKELKHDRRIEWLKTGKRKREEGQDVNQGLWSRLYARREIATEKPCPLAERSSACSAQADVHLSEPS